MAKRKKYTNEEGQICLCREDLLEVELYRARFLEREAYSREKQHQADLAVLNHENLVRNLIQQSKDASQQALSLRQEQRELFDRLGPKYEVDFSQSTYDDVTGIITMIEEKSPNRTNKRS